MKKKGLDNWASTNWVSKIYSSRVMPGWCWSDKTGLNIRASIFGLQNYVRTVRKFLLLESENRRVNS